MAYPYSVQIFALPPNLARIFRRKEFWLEPNNPLSRSVFDLLDI